MTDSLRGPEAAAGYSQGVETEWLGHDRGAGRLPGVGLLVNKLPRLQLLDPSPFSATTGVTIGGLSGRSVVVWVDWYQRP
jgi:hypothetical protein